MQDIHVDCWHYIIYTYIYICLHYIGTQSKCTKRWKQSSVIKLLLKTLFLTIKIYTDFTTDVIQINTVCAVSLANHLRTVADALEHYAIKG